MNFFEAQDRTRRKTRWLVVLYAIATLVIAAAVALLVEIGMLAAGTTSAAVEGAPLFAIDPLRALIVGAIVLALVLLTSAYRVAQLRDGGARVAQELGGTLVNADIRDPDLVRLRNVVEEMAIASGVPVPQIFVLEQEPGINAFAAGFSTSDAAVAVTRGCLEHLNRDELQGVIAHEFSHILNGDMRLNIRLMGVLFGIIAIGYTGRLLLRSMRHRRFSSRNSRDGLSVAIVIGIGLFVIGSVGVQIARLIRAGVSRQREYLADASAVQFTRQTAGIAGALTKIGQLAAGSRLQEADAEQVSHMLFATGARAAWLRAFASHPPLESRIRALDPSRLRDLPTPAAARTAAPAADARLVANLVAPGAAADIDATTVTQQAGTLGDTEIAVAEAIRNSIPASLYDATHSREWAFYVALALALSDTSADRARQLETLERRVGMQRVARIEAFVEQLDELGPRYRLPILELCFPALKQRPAGQLQFLLELIALIHETLPGIAFREYVFRTMLTFSLQTSLDPSHPPRPRITHLGRRRTRAAAAGLIWYLAVIGHETETLASAAYRRGSAALDLPTEPPSEVPPLTATDDLLGALRGLVGVELKRLLDALMATAAHDGRISVAESELLRLISLSLGCPVPPVIDRQLTRTLAEAAGSQLEPGP